MFDYGFCISAGSRSWYCVVLYILFLNMSCQSATLFFENLGALSWVKGEFLSWRTASLLLGPENTKDPEGRLLSMELTGFLESEKKVWIGVRPSCESWHVVVSFSGKEMATHSSILAWRIPWTFSVQFSSIPQSCPTLCDPMNFSTPGLLVHH